MAAGKGKRWGLIALVVLVVLIAGGIIGFRVAVGLLKGKVVEALGPDSEIIGIRVGWASVDVEGLRIKGPKGWPAADTLRAERIAVVPGVRSVLSGQFRVHSITIVRPYLSVLRTKDGQLQMIPSLLAGATGKGPPAGSSAPAAAPRTVTAGRITLSDGVVELFDATVTQPPLRIRIEQIQATVRDVVVPALTGKTGLDLAGVLKGVQRDGTVAIAGWAEIASKDSSLYTALRSVDLVALQPYLIKARETGVQKGTLDLELQSDVRENRLKAPGKPTISDLELTPAKDAFSTFIGVPRDAVVASLKNKDNKIAVNFVLEGDINNPQSSLNEALTTQLASSMAETLGVSLGGPEQVLKYLSRYTHRVAISNHRLRFIGEGIVRFAWKDYADHNVQKEMTLTAPEFLRRFLLHVLPRGVMRLRHYGLLANRHREQKLARCRTLLRVPAPAADPTATLDTDRDALNVPVELLPPCPLCGSQMSIIELLPARAPDTS